MLYDFKLGNKAAEAHQNVCKAFGDDIISESQSWAMVSKVPGRK
jgi:hypothetical protein